MVIYVDANHNAYATERPGCAAINTQVFDGMPPIIVSCYKYYQADDTHVEFVQAKVSVEIISTLIEEAQKIEGGYKNGANSY